MAGPAPINSYLNNHYEGMEPEQLILLLYKGALERIRLTREGIDENDIKKRGENLSKTIAIISELHASVNTTMNDESTLFLRGLYTSILMELPKVSLNNDPGILKQTHTYISRLKEIWENDVMKKDKAVVQKKAVSKRRGSTGYGSSAGKTTTFHSFAV